MNMRKITSLTASLSFIVVVVTSVILYIVPQGRVAYWADWHLWRLDKEAWGAVHINVGLLFLLSLFLHIYYNWKPLMAYLKDRSRRMKIFTPSNRCLRPSGNPDRSSRPTPQCQCSACGLKNCT